jgi:hypothetical protein
LSAAATMTGQLDPGELRPGADVDRTPYRRLTRQLI